jgi:hypothetical protein
MLLFSWGHLPHRTALAEKVDSAIFRSGPHGCEEILPQKFIADFHDHTQSDCVTALANERRGLSFPETSVVLAETDLVARFVEAPPALGYSSIVT